MRYQIPFLLVCVFLSSCGARGALSPSDYLRTQNILVPEKAEAPFQHCYNYGCDRKAMVMLTDKDWKDIDKKFAPLRKSPEEERAAISAAIGAFEQIVGKMVGTEKDVYGTFRNLSGFQHDCVDESINTTVYLMLLKQRGVLAHHDVMAPETRFPLIHGGRWPHRTAVIYDREGNAYYAVDSWFHDNGFPAEIVSLTLWKAGWKAEENFTHTGEQSQKE